MPYSAYRQASKSGYGAGSPILKPYPMQGSPQLGSRPNSRLASSPANSPGGPGSPMHADLSSSIEKQSSGSPIIINSNPPPIFMQTTEVRQQIQNDAQSAAALVALQNVKNQAIVRISY